MTYQHRMTPLPAQYDTAATEKKWQRHWLDAKTYAWDENESREHSYVIDTPPPTVSGHLHMGHVFSYTQADFIARYQRMAGKNVFYPMGFDDNGLPTERLVEKTIKKRATDMSREAFIAECMNVSEEARKDFRALFESIALSVDWAQEYHTISEDARRLSQLSFLDLVAKGHVYRAQRPFYWDPVDQTAIASAEIVDKEMASFQNFILFELIDSPPAGGGIEGGGNFLPVMTTRPELLPACVALFYHPDDARYQHLKNQHAIVPLFGHRVPILEDDTVEPAKGTGLMMCCTFGDDADIQKWEKHKLPMRVMLNKYGKMDFAAIHPHPQAGAGPSLSLTEGEGWGEGVAQILTTLTGKKTTNPDPKNPGAREIIIELLKIPPLTPPQAGGIRGEAQAGGIRGEAQAGGIRGEAQAGVNLSSLPPLAGGEGGGNSSLLVSQKPITHAVKCAERSGAPLEILPTEQWFVRLTDKKEALKAKSAECNWHPEWMRVRMEQWIDGLNQDWCISRQRYFGVPFPVWYVQESGGRGQVSEICATADMLPVNPITTPPPGFTIVKKAEAASDSSIPSGWIVRDSAGKEYRAWPDMDVMDTWATSSISPQLSAGAIHDELQDSPPPPPASGGDKRDDASGGDTEKSTGGWGTNMQSGGIGGDSQLTYPPRLRGGAGGKGLFGQHPDTTRNAALMSHAKAMRNEMTAQEWKVWEVLSGKKMEGFKFRRQQTVGNYIVDFVCMEKKIIVEIDGGQHDEKRKTYDADRTTYLESLGYRVLRFWNNEVTETLEGVHTTILKALKDSPPPPPASGGDKNTHAGANHASRFSKLFPADLRPQAHEIIRTWAFYTLVKAHLHSDSIPWKNLMISGWCLAEDKSKMSKSKGNIVTPVALIEERGTDAVRYWAATSRLGMDTAFSPDLLKIGRKLVGKLWNATQFAAIHLSKMTQAPTTAATDEAITEVFDRWILSRLAETVQSATEAFESYEYAVALDATNIFFWADFCDNYLELIKKRAYNEDGSFSPAQQQSAIRTLYYCLDAILTLYAPFVPHVTEELYAHIFADAYAAKGSLHARGMWVKSKDYPVDVEAIRAGKDAVLILEKIRSKKSDENKSIKYPVQQARISTERSYDIPTRDRDRIARDLEGAGNLISPLVWEHAQVDGLASGGITNADITLAAEADAA